MAHALQRLRRLVHDRHRDAYQRRHGRDYQHGEPVVAVILDELDA